MCLLLCSVSLVCLINLASLWVRSYGVQDELRWMLAGVHRHLEVARGTITFVSTGGQVSSDYFIWASSPDLSYDRASNWYAVRTVGEPRWHLRVHCVVPTLFAAAVSAGALLQLLRTRTARTAARRQQRV